MGQTTISIKSPTPLWATIIFRVVLLVAFTANTAIVNAPGIPESLKLTIVYWSGVLITFIWALSRILGVKIKPEENEQAPNKLMDGGGPGNNPPDSPPIKPPAK